MPSFFIRCEDSPRFQKELSTTDIRQQKILTQGSSKYVKQLSPQLSLGFLNMLSDAVVYYYFDGSMVGLLNCVFRAFQFKEFHVQLCLNQGAQHGLFATVVEIPNHEQHAARVWSALQQKLSHSSLRQFYFAYLSESLDAYQHLFNYCIYVFGINIQSKKLLSSQCFSDFAMDEKGRARKASYGSFVRFKKTTDGLFLSLVRPDFNVLPLIQPHF